eukprot:gene16361-19464_t
MCDYEDSTTDPIVVEAMEKLTKQREAKGKHLRVIFTSGTWTYGHFDDNTVVNEKTPYRCPELELGRVELEKKYTAMNASIIQCTVLYGGSGSLSADWFKAIEDKSKETIDLYLSSDEQIIGFIHATDLAELYVLVAEAKRELVDGEKFIACQSCHKIVDVIKDLMKAAGVSKTFKFLKPTDPFTECLTISQQVSSDKAYSTLNWHPTQPSMQDDPARYLKAWRQCQQPTSNNNLCKFLIPQ